MGVFLHRASGADQPSVLGTPQPTRRCNPHNGAPQLHLSSCKTLWKPEVTRPTTAASAPMVQRSSGPPPRRPPLKPLTASVFLYRGAPHRHRHHFSTSNPFFLLGCLLLFLLLLCHILSSHSITSLPCPFSKFYLSPIHTSVFLCHLYKQGMDSL